jgi:DNA mismatch repair ATPase MutS
MNTESIKNLEADIEVAQLKADATAKEQKQIQAVFTAISSHAIKGEVAAWSRKRKSIERVITTNIRPLEDKIIEANAALIPLYDQITTMRAEMVEFCIHPIDMLIYKEDHVECKFCNRKLNVPTLKA